MTVKPMSRRPIGRQAATPRRKALAPAPPLLEQPAPPDPALGVVATEPDARMVQAKRDLDAGQVDTDMHATPGLDAQRRADLVPGPGGRAPAVKPA